MVHPTLYIRDRIENFVRIVSLAPAITETLVKLGLESQIVGTSPYCIPWLTERKQVLRGYTDIHVERLKELRPDLVLLQSAVQDRVYEKARSAGLHAHLIPLPVTIQGILENISRIGSLTNRYHEAKELVAKLLEKLDQLRRNLEKPSDEKIRVYVEYLWPDWSYCAAGSLTFMDDGVWWAGGINIFHDRPQTFFTPSNKEIAEKSPDIVLVNLEPGMRIGVGEYLKRRGLGFSEDIIKLVPETREVNLAHPGPSFVKTILWMAKLFEEFGDEG